MSQKLEIWTTAQKWMTMKENVKKEEKTEKDERKMKKTKKNENKKIKLTFRSAGDLKFGPQIRCKLNENVKKKNRKG